jgi:hypothetical protein
MEDGEWTVSVRYSIPSTGSSELLESVPVKMTALGLLKLIHERARISIHGVVMLDNQQEQVPDDTEVGDIAAEKLDGLRSVVLKHRSELTHEPHDPQNGESEPDSGSKSSIVVRVENEDGEFRSFSVEIECNSIRKPFLGGFRNRTTMTEYHHSSTQTPIVKKNVARAERLTRETQTVDIKARSQQTYREQGTQMAKPGVFIDDAEDKTMMPNPDYFNADELVMLRLEKIITIQSHIRGWFARVRTRKLRDALEEKRMGLMKEKEQQLIEEEQRRQFEIERRMHPRTAEDFKILYTELDAWRDQETSKIKRSGLPVEDQKLALAELLKKETKLLQTIDRLKTASAKENREQRIGEKLSQMSEEKEIKMEDGKVTIETPFTTRARELAELYAGLRLSHLSTDERLDVLLHVKWTVKEFDCQLTREIVELIDREADLLNRGRPSKTLDGLRTRISNLFLQFIENPEFNPEAAKFMKVPIKYMKKPQLEPIVKKGSRE